MNSGPLSFRSSNSLCRKAKEEIAMRRRTLITLTIACATVLGAVVFTYTAYAQNSLDVCSSSVDIASLLPGGAHVDPDVAATVAEAAANFAAALAQVPSAHDLSTQMQVLGKLGLNDQSLSVDS